MLAQSCTNKYMNEAYEFLQVLHHDALNRKGFFVKKTFGDHRKEVWAQSSLALLQDYIELDAYVSLHSYHGKTRDGISTHSLNALYFDLDWHNEQKWYETPIRTENTLKALKLASESKMIPYPTMITKTGRGLGLFYVLDKSIANTIKTTKQVRLWEYVYKELSSQIENLLSNSDSPVLELDHKVVADKARICRLPGTMNSKAGKLCSLFEINEENGAPKYYTLKELASFVPNYNIYNNDIDKTSSLRKNNVINFESYKSNLDTAAMLLRRLKKLERAQEVFKNTIGQRELLCFYYYNTACQLYTPLEAQQMLFTYNDQFSQPINNQELTNIIHSVSSAVDQAGKIKGYYKITDRRIYQNLELEQKLNNGIITQAQIDYIGLAQASKTVRRAEIKANNMQKKAERDQAIVNYLTEHLATTYKEVAALFGVSLRTINNIVKKYNIHRYEVSEKPEDEVSICATENQITEPVFDTPSAEPIAPIYPISSKVQKNALVSYCCGIKLNNIKAFNKLLNKNQKISVKPKIPIKTNLIIWENSG